MLPEILYSSLISFVINLFLKHLALLEKGMLDLKTIDSLKEAIRFGKSLQKCANIKYMIFFS